jgi:predicted flavoprotein YhiN
LLPQVNLGAEIVMRRTAGDLASTKTAVAAHLPRRLADRWFDVMTTQSSTIATTGDAAIRALEESLHAWTVTPAGTEGFDKAEVTAGGVDTRALSSTTMEVRAQQGLYFIGEVVDVTGHLGGSIFSGRGLPATRPVALCSNELRATIDELEQRTMSNELGATNDELQRRTMSD